MNLDQRIEQKLARQKASSRFRTIKARHAASPVHVVLNEQQYLAFTSNDYLGMSQHPGVVKAFCDSASEYGVGSGSAHGLYGHTLVHQQLEEKLAAHLGTEDCLLFGSGYQANLAIGSFMSRHDLMLQDKLNHASLLDAAALSACPMKRYQHLELDHLESLLKQASGPVMVVSDTVFSMDGDRADLQALLTLSQQYRAWLVLDDAHGFATTPGAISSIQQAGIDPALPALTTITLGKAIGCSGAVLAGSKDRIEYLRQFSRSYTYTTAMPPALAAAALASLQVLQKDHSRAEKLAANIRYFRQQSAKMKLPFSPSDTAIQVLELGTEQAVLEAREAVQEHGILVSAIRPPTVPEGRARLRISLSALHSETDIVRLLHVLQQVLES